MIFRFFVFTTIVLSLFACTSHDPEADYSTSDTLAFNLIKICIDKTLSIHSEFNTQNYVLDLTQVETLKKGAVDSFYKIKNAGLPATYDDSIIAFQNKSLSRSRVLEFMILKIDEVEYIDNKNVYVMLRKTRSANQVIKIGLDLERVGDSYKIIKSEIRR